MCLYPYTECYCRVMKKISNKFRKGAPTILIILVSFAKLEKVGPIFFKFQSISIRCNRRQETVLMTKNSLK